MLSRDPSERTTNGCIQPEGKWIPQERIWYKKKEQAKKLLIWVGKSKSIIANFGGFQIIMESLITITCYQGSRIIVFKSRIGFSSTLYCVR